MNPAPPTDILHASHLVLAVADVEAQTTFFSKFFAIEPYFANREFSEFVLPSGFRIAFFRPVGKTTQFFSNDGERHHASIGITTHDVEALYRRALEWQARGVRTSGPPKDHPWGEKSFLLICPSGFRWEITRSPTPEGKLVNRHDTPGQS